MNKYCVNCGQELIEGVKYCPKCGTEASNVENINNNVNTGHQSTNYNSTSVQIKSKIAAGLFGIFLGALGIYNFYLGYTGKAVTQLLLTLVGWIVCGLGPMIAGIWGLIEGILILTGSINRDANGNPLND